MYSPHLPGFTPDTYLIFFVIGGVLLKEFCQPSREVQKHFQRAASVSICVLESHVNNIFFLPFSHTTIMPPFKHFENYASFQYWR